MHEIIQLIKDMMNAETLANMVMAFGGLYIVALIIFAETGLFAGFFLPGDSLLFIAGLLVAKEPAPLPSGPLSLLYWIVLISIAGIVGNAVGYWFGRKAGPLLYERRETWLFKRKHLVQAHDFFEKRGGGAIILARFLPIVRTFAPIVAGIVKMDRKKFVFYNFVGSFAWVSSMMTAGFLLGRNEWVTHNFEKIVIGIIVITTGPVLFKMFFGKKKHPIQEVVEDMTNP